MKLYLRVRRWWFGSELFDASGGIPRELFYCVNCQGRGALGIHGRCSSCDSDAVVSLEASRLSQEALEVSELEKMVRLARKI